MVELENGPVGQWNFWNDNFRSHLPNFRNNEQAIEQSMCRVEEYDEFLGESVYRDLYNHSKVHKSECAPVAMGPWMA